jgi:hypothetical protein
MEPSYSGHARATNSCVKALLLLAAFSLTAFGAEVCNPRNFEGSYAFQLSGNTRISATARPAAAVGSLTFDGSGGVSGYSSAQYAGYLQGNPTSGKYEAHVDCSLDFSLQDTSGAFQNFSGKMTADTRRIEFRQTDQGGPQRGIMIRTPDSCSANTLQQQYQFSILGSFTPMLDGQAPHVVSITGTAQVKDGGKLLITYKDNPNPEEGTFEVDSDCVVRIAMTSINLRGYLVDGGKQILAIQTDAGFTVTASFK